MNPVPIPQHEPRFGREEANAVSEYILGGGWLTEHTKTTEFENAIAAFTGARHCIVVPNGTLSLTLAALALGIGPGDEVIVPDYSMIATATAFAMVGARPVFVDVEPETLCMDIGVVVKAITQRTKAIVLVTANGRSPHAGIAAFETLCHDTSLDLIEDAAQSLGSCFPDWRHCGRAGIVGSFSFSAPKIISTGQGGAIITHSDRLAERIRRLKDFGRSGGGTDVHDTVGYNFKTTDLQAVVGIEQMRKLRSRLEAKRWIQSLYWNLLADVAQVSFFQVNLSHHTPWFVDILAERRDELKAHLAANGIGTRKMYPPMHRQQAFARLTQAGAQFQVAERVGRDGLWLPSSSHLTNADIERVCKEIRNFYGAQ